MSLDRLSAALSDRYTLERELGQGGMATVYLARDLKHERQVALKVLRPELAAVIGAERFLSEIRTTANLQHPHILPLFDSGMVQAPGLSHDPGLTTHLYYVMPFVEGESLRDRLNREKQLPIADAVRIASEVASALDYAHRHAVIHRDIKPENILLHDGQALVADFGIALAASRTGSGSRLTETGMSLGTPHYMSPEQAMGERDLDARTDVYALGCVLYEMLAGEPPFTGPTAQAIVAKVMTAAPEPVTTYRKTVPPHVEDAVHTALQKLPADRFEGARDFAAALAGSGTGTRQTSGIVRDRPPTTARWLRDGRSIAALVVLAALGGWALLGRRPTGDLPEYSRKDYLFFGDSLTPVTGAGRAFALSPDGRDLVYITEGSAGAQAALARKRIDRLQPIMIPGTEQAKWPMFSPDGSRLLFVRAFLTNGSLETIPLGGGAARTMVADSVFLGAAWGDDGYIYYSRLGSLLRIPENGGAVDTLTTHPDNSQVNDRTPIPVPGGRGVLFGRQVGTGGTDLMAFDLRSRETRRLGTGLPLAVIRDRILLYSPEGVTVEAVRFDPDRFEHEGEPIRVTPNLEQTGFGNANVTFSDSGSMVYWADAGAATRAYWVDRNGGSREIDTDWRTPLADAPKLSPDGHRLALSTALSVEVKQLDRGPSARIISLAKGHNYLRPEWRPDGRALLVYQSGGKDSVFTVRDDGIGGLASTVDESRGVAHAIWSPDQRWIVFRTSVEGTNGADIYAQRADGEGPLLPVVTSPGSDVTPVFSPDGRWLAYASDESGTFEVYLRPFPNVDDRRVKVSVRGGTQPRWAIGSGELFFVGPENRMMATRVRTAPTLVVDPPQPLFPVTPFRLNTPFHQQYDVAPGGQRFVMVATGGLPQIVRVDNWLADYPELQR
jgi:serine/threonine-protein kinase